jgi:nucleoside 2-deoxyribosyltransferase
MKKVYICSPYAGDTRRNKEYARMLTNAALKSGCAPITPHLYITEVLDDNNPAERKAGMAAAIELLRDCDALVIGCDFGISDGMAAEIAFAVGNGIPRFLAYECYVQNGAVSDKAVKFIDITGCPCAVTPITKIEI